MPASAANADIFDIFLSFGKTERAVPADPIPSIAVLITMNAKWCERYMEKSLVREISNVRAPHETRKMAG